MTISSIIYKRTKIDIDQPATQRYFTFSLNNELQTKQHPTTLDMIFSVT